MFWTISRRRREASLSALVLILAATAAHADAIQPSYTVTDLGPTGSILPTGGVVIAADGHTAYPFPQTFTPTPMSASDWANLPVPEPPPQTYGFNIPNSSTAIDATQYPNGIVLAIDQVVQNNGDESQQYIPYYVQRNPDGPWGTPVALGQGYEHAGPAIPGDGSPGVTLALDKSGDILVSRAGPNWPTQFDLSVYHMNTKAYTDITSLPVLVNNGYSSRPSSATPTFGWSRWTTMDVSCC
jgi:hypothetical protein